MKKEQISKFTRKDIMAIDRLPKAISDMKKKYSFDFVKKSYMILNFADRDSWAKDCLIPWAGFKQLVQITSMDDFFGLDSEEEAFQLMDKLYYLSIWSLSKGIYRFNTDLS